MATTIDTLKYVKALEDAGVDRKLAEAHATALRGAVEDGVATQSDLKDTEQDIRADIATVKADIQLLKWMISFVLAGVMVLIWRQLK